MDFIDVNLPGYTAECRFRVQVYLMLVCKGLPDWNDEDRADWLFATGRVMPKVSA